VSQYRYSKKTPIPDRPIYQETIHASKQFVENNKRLPTANELKKILFIKYDTLMHRAKVLDQFKIIIVRKTEPDENPRNRKKSNVETNQ